ncbi:Mur ligase [Athelia psychrophila]|uniref:tetrahydrofolate synthase n=1 Tax=Athelia psychrophila TaxID=1759441 RepID=A0A166T3A7_9AGAM|nr:Mur ligase [Fibularhizoctonia sp. CBS 109695]
MDNTCGEPDDLNKLNVIHVTGTKGKGSTSAFTSSILLLCKAKPDWKIGLYTSPHIAAVRERVRVNGRLISEEFAKFFFEVWDSLEAPKVCGYLVKFSLSLDNARLSRDTLQTLLRNPCTSVCYLVAFHAFYTLKVDATILEVGIGGTYNSTIIVPKPVVTGITSLGLGHQGVLGVPALPVNQPDDAMEVLRKRAEELKASEFTIVPATGLSDIELGLAGAHQVLNACLAVAMAQKFLEVKESLKPESTLSKAFVEGLEQVRWPGRCQIIQDPKGRATWFLDGAHTIESLDCCIRWFVSPGVAIPLEASYVEPLPCIRMFNITHGRSGPSLLRAMNAAKLDQLKLYGRDEDPEMIFDEAIFCTNTTYIDGASNHDLVSLRDASFSNSSRASS